MSDRRFRQLALRWLTKGSRPRADRGRNVRSRAVRARSIPTKRLSRAELELGRALWPEEPVDRPITRADCIDGPRPCPFVSCKHHLYLDVSPRTGSIKVNFPDLEVHELGETCVLDLADRGGMTLHAVGAVINITRERVRQVQRSVEAKFPREETHASGGHPTRTTRG